MRILKLLAFSTIIWVSLHQAQVFSQTFDETTRIIPIPTARPDGGATGTPSFIPAPTGTEKFPKSQADLQLSAHIKGQEETLHSGVTWRIYGSQEGKDGKLPMLGTFTGGKAFFNLPAGYYYVHSAYGYTERIKRIKLLPPQTNVSFSLDAGGLRLNAAFREGDIIPAKDLNFDIAKLEGNTLNPLASDVKADELVHLPEGQYHVSSHYGTINSQTSANVRVLSGKITDLTLYQRGAEVTLKLVSELGGEAMANTSWSVLTPGGDPVINTVASAFPSFVLAAGDYVAFAHHEGTNYRADFTIESGIHRDVEVLLK